MRSRPAAQGAKIRDRLSQHNVMAEFADMHAARLAVEALGNAGIEGDDISLTGTAADRAAEPSQQRVQETTREIDARMVKHLAGVISVWTVAGVVAGAIIGALVAIAIVELFGDDLTLGGIVVGMLLGALIVGIVSWLISQIAYPLQAAPPWELTFAESKPGRVRVGVHSDTTGEIERAEQALRKQSPLDIYRIDASGRRI